MYRSLVIPIRSDVSAIHTDFLPVDVQTLINNTLDLVSTTGHCASATGRSKVRVIKSASRFDPMRSDE